MWDEVPVLLSVLDIKYICLWIFLLKACLIRTFLKWYRATIQPHTLQSMSIFAAGALGKVCKQHTEKKILLPGQQLFACCCSTESTKHFSWVTSTKYRKGPAPQLQLPFHLFKTMHFSCFSEINFLHCHMLCLTIASRSLIIPSPCQEHGALVHSKRTPPHSNKINSKNWVSSEAKYRKTPMTSKEWTSKVSFSPALWADSSRCLDF